jgi:hypothetical protein
MARTSYLKMSCLVFDKFFNFSRLSGYSPAFQYDANAI